VCKREFSLLSVLFSSFAFSFSRIFFYFIFPAYLHYHHGFFAFMLLRGWLSEALHVKKPSLLL